MLLDEHQDRTEYALCRRQFLKAGLAATGTAAAIASPLSILPAAPTKTERNCIILFMVGGPSHLETWDPKPAAPESIRGPFRPTATNVPGLLISEHLPKLAQRANRYALVRSIYHEAPAIHETGQQLLQTGHLSRPGLEYPSIGAVLASLNVSTATRSMAAIVPGPIGNTGVAVSHGQNAGFLGDACSPNVLASKVQRALAHQEPVAVRERYGKHRFAQSCLVARKLVEAGTRLVTVNMFDTVFNEVTWDCHADGGSLATSLDDYRTTLCPLFDSTCATLLDDLADRGLLDSTLVVAMGEFGRTPIINPRGGRDHWPHVWSVMFAGGPVKGGQVIGSSDKHGAEPRDRPVHASQVAATIQHVLGIDPQMVLTGRNGEPIPVAQADPIWELLR